MCDRGSQRYPHSLRSAAKVAWLASLVALAWIGAPASATAQSRIIGFGTQVFDSDWSHESFVEIAAGGNQTLARRADGSVVAWGENVYLECSVPPLPPGLTYVEITAGGGFVVGSNAYGHAIARRSDGSAIGWGYSSHGQTSVPPLPPGVVYVDVSAGYRHSAACLSDGSVVTWGDFAYGKGTVPPLPPSMAYVEVAAGYNHTVARRSDGSVVAWGLNLHGVCDVPALPPGLAYVEIATGDAHALALRSDGSVVGWAATSSASATCHPCHRASPTSRSLPRATTA